ncbi:MAG: radical SAM protein [Polyangiaceae bacterium]|nr:radical SAM protein [Myxococcales bacterium]MCB9588189.1 radical SAM protein [Polyangiaceae bacterium]
MKLRDYSFLGLTQSLCPDCHRVVSAKIITRGKRVYFQKHCPEHGAREDFICSDVDYYDRLEFAVPGKIPAGFGISPKRGCPYDCGLCTEHEQHTCIGLVELTQGCNLRCPMCYASSAPGGAHESLEDVKRAIDRLVAAEGQAEILQLSGGEPTLHPDFEQVLAYAYERNVQHVMVNTNGLRFARDPKLVEHVARYERRFEVYFQLDSLEAKATESLRGADILAEKLEALDLLAAHDVRVTLVATLQPGINDNQLGALIDYAVKRPNIGGVSFQPATYSGRSELPETLERRVTFPDVVKGIAEQTAGLFRETDFMPLPCAHPNCHTLSYAYRDGERLYPLLRFIDAQKHKDLLANGIAFDRPRARQLVEEYLRAEGCSAGDCATVESWLATALGQRQLSQVGAQDAKAVVDFFGAALNETLSPERVFRIAITSFLDVYNFDLRRVMKCCTHHVLPSGHVIPFCAYNVLYRPGHAALPELESQLIQLTQRTSSD